MDAISYICLAIVVILFVMMYLVSYSYIKVSKNYVYKTVFEKRIIMVKSKNIFTMTIVDVDTHNELVLPTALFIGNYGEVDFKN